MSNYASYTHGQDNARPEYIPQSGPQVYIRDTVTSVSTVDGVVTETTQGHQKGTAAELSPFHGANNFAATARNVNGSPVMELLPSTLVTLDGMQAPVSFWVTEGRLQKGADGNYSEAAGNAPAQQEDRGDYFPMPDSHMGRVNEALALVDQDNLDALIGLGTGAAIGRLDTATLAYKFGQMSGLDTGESQARLTTIKAAYQGQADAALTGTYGIAPADLPSFYAWAKENRQGALTDAVQKQVRGHDLSGYRAIAAQWLSATPPSMASLKDAGYAVRKQGAGDEVFVKGSWMSRGAAARSGFI